MLEMTVWSSETASVYKDLNSVRRELKVRQKGISVEQHAREGRVESLIQQINFRKSGSFGLNFKS